MSPPDHKKFHLGVARATRLWVRHISCKIRIPIDLYPCQVEKKLIVKEVKGETITKYETKITVNDGTVTKLPGKFPRYPPLNEEEEKPNKGPNYELLSYKVSDGDSDLKSTARSGPKYSELEDTWSTCVEGSIYNYDGQQLLYMLHNTSGLASMISRIDVNMLVVNAVNA
ncbi:hypothetical protein Tco_1014178 [Tanacetum coccineum]